MNGQRNYKSVAWDISFAVALIGLKAPDPMPCPGHRDRVILVPMVSGGGPKLARSPLYSTPQILARNSKKRPQKENHHEREI